MLLRRRHENDLGTAHSGPDSDTSGGRHSGGPTAATAAPASISVGG